MNIYTCINEVTYIYIIKKIINRQRISKSSIVILSQIYRYLIVNMHKHIIGYIYSIPIAHVLLNILITNYVSEI